MSAGDLTLFAGGSDWSPSSWRAKPALQQPAWPDEAELEQATKALRDLPPLVFAGEARSLMSHLGRVANGEAFLLQAGDCAESFDSSADSIRDKLRVILQMAIVLTYSGGVPLVKVGRIAGQFAKPRSSPTETKGEVELTSFLGHMVNDIGFSEAERLPDPRRLLTAYHRAASTLNLLRAFTRGGYADLSRVASWNREFVATSPAGRRYSQMADEIDRALQFMTACGVTTTNTPQLHEVEFYTSHEALVLDFEEALTREDSTTGDWYDCSAHMLWIGERTRQLEGAHVEFLRGVKNPLGCKIGPTATADEVVALCELLNPQRITRPAHPHHQDGGRQGGDAAAPAAAGRARLGPPGGLGLRPDARQHLHIHVGAQDPRLRRRAGRDKRLLRGPHRLRHLARGRTRGADGRRGNRVHRGRRQDPRR